MVPDTAKPTTLELCRAEGASAWLIRKCRVDLDKALWEVRLPATRSYRSACCSVEQSKGLALEKEALHLRSVGIGIENTGARSLCCSLCFLGEKNTLSREGTLKMSLAEQQPL